MWFSESAWPPIFVCIGLAGVCLSVWFSTRRGIALAGAAALVALCPLIYLGERLIVTEAERVEAAVLDIAAAYQRRDLEGTLALVAEDATWIRELVRWTMEAYEVRNLRITDLSVRMNHEREAISHFRANATIASRGGGFGSGHYPTRWEFTWRRESGGWKLTALRPLEVVTGDPDERLERHLNRGN